MFFHISQSVDFDAPCTFFFFDFLYHCYGAETRPDLLEAYAIPPTPLTGWADTGGYRHCADGMSGRLNVHNGVWMKLWSTSTNTVHLSGGLINVNLQFCLSLSVVISGSKRNFLGGWLSSLDVVVDRFILCKPSRR